MPMCYRKVVIMCRIEILSRHGCRVPRQRCSREIFKYLRSKFGLADRTVAANVLARRQLPESGIPHNTCNSHPTLHTKLGFASKYTDVNPQNPLLERFQLLP
ncbi:hypothetical protein BU24DRAFT_272808 [Aaosphaeria arxii CBS 175.79]|uniref:Uncharacterized protein n=1 Tax=Aaosphaeria arxii CBS 175.79 TaxID=1450172 RepID=A0A6A5XHF8_9PLEO|nr:uncharacterized protein BU24DRAFT_272808 [Aaosphaeria arxii CBS 175.79]KAF2012241.1 hypothetical protein BU24DRAFT_272808 [Aaosphaeria arxii CBS 175.79]